MRYCLSRRVVDYLLAWSAYVAPNVPLFGPMSADVYARWDHLSPAEQADANRVHRTLETVALFGGPHAHPEFFA